MANVVDVADDVVEAGNTEVVEVDEVDELVVAGARVEVDVDVVVAASGTLVLVV